MSSRPLAQGHRELMAQHQDLGVLPPRLPPRQAQHRHGPGDDEEDQLQAHKPKIIARQPEPDRPPGTPSRDRADGVPQSICPGGASFRHPQVRTQLLTLGAGVFAAGALVYTARNFTLSRRTYQLTEQGQVTDRYTRAIEQLGSDKLDVRIGGIYALERIARDSARDHPTVMEVLAAFIREHSREPWPPRESAVPPATERFTRPDVQAALTVIGRRQVSQDGWEHIGLTGAVLPGALLFHTNLTNVRLVSADLTRANLIGADLTEANLTGAVLDGANLTRAELTGARRSDQDPVPDGWMRDPGTGTLKRVGLPAGEADT